MGWIVFLGLGFSLAALSVRAMMIQAGMVRDLLAHDPTFKPQYGAGFSGSSQATYNVREYRARMPGGPLNAKLRHTYWAFGAWGLLSLIALSMIRSQLRL